VAIGIGLDHSKGLPPRRAALGDGVVVGNGGEVDDGGKRTHDRKPEEKTGPHLNRWAPVFIDLCRGSAVLENTARGNDLFVFELVAARC
jgi:hypothetical protein